MVVHITSHNQIDKLKERKIIVDGGEKQQRIMQQQNQEKLVAQNLLKIKIAQMERLISKQTDKAFSLEKHKMELEAAMNDRLIDIGTQMDILQMKRRCLMDERTQMKADIADRLLKIEQLKKRYACAMDLLGRNEDGTTVTAVQIKIEMAQEKFMLLNQGNELNGRILKGENEIKCMENALKLMNFSNDEYRKVFDTIKEHSPEMKRMHDLQNQYFRTMDDIKELKANLITLIDHLELLESQRQEVERELDEVLRTKLDNNDALLKIHKELLDQETKKERADREMKTAYKNAKRRLKDQDFMNLFTRNIEFKEFEERNNSALQQLADLVDSHNEMTQTVTRYFLERGLSLPANVRRTKSQCSFKSETSLGEQSSSKGDMHCSKRCKLKSLCLKSKYL
jgi:chromosome segregation ATPase